MSDLETNLRTVITGNGTVSDIQGTRLFATFLPENCPMPASAYQVLAFSRNLLADGTPDLAQVPILISCFADQDSGGYAKVRQLAQAIQDLLTGIRGEFGDATVDSIRLTDYHDATFDEVTLVFRIDQTFEIWTADL